VLLTRTLYLRAEIARLRQANPDLAEGLVFLSRITQRGETLLDDDLAGASATARRRHAHRLKYDQLLAAIRTVPGMADFLTSADTPALPALPGPIVAVNVARSGCDALVSRYGTVSRVRLNDLTYDDARNQANRLLVAVSGDADDPGRSEARDRDVQQVLTWLWNTTVEPILRYLKGNGGLPDPRPRVWWIPTGPMTVLPLHAAGRPGVPGSSALDRVTSSYVPTMRALVGPAHSRDIPPILGDGGSVVVAVPRPAGLPALPSAVAEAADVAALLRRSSHDQVHVLLDADATRATVLDHVRRCAWVHVACHAQATANPADSHLVLHDGSIDVRQLAELHLSGARFAYLSACTTAHGGVELVDEAIHVTSAFHLAGFRHVVGSLWPIEDAIARRTARDTYTALAAHSPALALHTAVRRLRDRYPTQPSVWAAYVHVGG
jgi:hypothetical protein